VSAPGIGTVDPEMEAWMVKGGPAIREVFRASSDLGYLVKMDVLGLSDDCNRLERIARTLRATLPSPDAELNSEIRGMTEDLIAVNSEPPCHYAVQIEGGEITDTGSTSVKRANKLWADADRHADRLRERLDALGY
jgi:hypothetical protein